jgi:hypothetical protein
MPATPFAAVLDRIDRASQSMLSDALATWVPSTGEPAREDVAVIFGIETIDAFLAKRSDAIKYLLADLPGLRKGEAITITQNGVAAEYVVGDTGLLTATRGIAWLNSKRGACA